MIIQGAPCCEIGVFLALSPQQTISRQRGAVRSISTYAVDISSVNKRNLTRAESSPFCIRPVERRGIRAAETMRGVKPVLFKNLICLPSLRSHSFNPIRLEVLAATVRYRQARLPPPRQAHKDRTAVSGKSFSIASINDGFAPHPAF